MDCHFLETLHVDRNEIEYYPSDINTKPNLKDFLISSNAIAAKHEKERQKREEKLTRAASTAKNKAEKNEKS